MYVCPMLSVEDYSLLAQHRSDFFSCVCVCAAIFRTAVSLPSINIYLFFLLLYEQIQEVEFHQLFVLIRTSSHFPL